MIKRRLRIKLKILLLLAVFMSLSYLGYPGYPGLAAAEVMETGKDIQGHWAEKTIHEWIGRNYIGGYADGTFRPDSAITRAEFVALVNRVFGYQETSSFSFTDVFPQDWFAQELAKASSVGYINGYADGSFQPNQQISRQETAAILTRILSLSDTGKNSAEKFSDQEDISAWSISSVNAAVDNGYLGGYPDGTFRPANSTTRAEAVSILERAAGRVYSQAGTYGPLQNKTTWQGNMTITKRDVVLKNTIITGNLYLTEGIGDGHVTLDNVTVMGTTKVSGGGVNSIILLDSTLGQVLINVPGNRKVRLVAQGATRVGLVEIRTDARLEEANLTDSGFNEVTVNSPEETARPEKIEVELLGNIKILTMDMPAVVKGAGTIETLQVNCNGADVKNIPGTVIVANGFTVLIEGQRITKTTTFPASNKKKRGNSEETPSNIAIVTSDIYTVSAGGAQNETIINVPYGTGKTDFLAALTKGEVNQTWDDTGIDDPVVSGNTLVVTAQDGTTQVVYTVTVDPLISDFTCTAHTEETADFSWAAATEATSLQIQLSEDNGESWINATHEPLATDAATARVTGLQEGTTYKFKLAVTGGLNAGDSNIVEVKTSTLVGVSWTSGTDTDMSRLGAGLGKTAGAEFDNIAPWKGMTLCNVTDDGDIIATIEEGSGAFRRDGTNGQVMVKIPKFYYKHTYDGLSKTHEFWVADGPAEDFKVHPCFIRDGQEKDYVLLGAYKASFGETEDGLETLNSLTGTLPAVDGTRGDYRTLAQNRGAGWGIVDVQTRHAVMLLYLVEYANTDSQQMIGQGISGLRFTTADKVIEATENANTIIVAPATGNYYSEGQIIDVETVILARDICANREIIDIDTSDPLKTVITVDGSPFTTVKTDTEESFIHHVPQRSGGCDYLQGATGMADGEDGKVSINYRGLEDIYGNTWEFTDGINIKNAERQPYIADSNFADNKFTDNYTASGIILPATGGFYKNFAYSEEADWLLMPSEVGGSVGNYIPDFYYQEWANGKDSILIAGGVWGESSTSQRGGFFRMATHYGAEDHASCDGSSRILFTP